MSHGMAWSNEVETSREIIDISMLTQIMNNLLVGYFLVLIYQNK